MTPIRSPLDLSPFMTDVQSLVDARRIPIHNVGVKDMCYPLRIKERAGGVQHTVGHFTMDVNLAHDRKGVHMSRFSELLNALECEISYSSFLALLINMVGRLEADSGQIELTFPYFINKTAPVSHVHSLMNYQIYLFGAIVEGTPQVRIRVVVPVTSLCPCSKEISEFGAHNQRSHITITATTNGHLWIEDLIRVAEDGASCDVYALLKRADEKYVTERAYDNPKFVEDTVRDLAIQLDRDERVSAYTVECENFESIHNHSVYARIEHQSNSVAHSATAQVNNCRY